jgi:hypothetical protein
MTPNPKQSERLLALAARVEAAEGPDRELDAEIGAMFFVEPKRSNVYRRGRYPLQLLRVKEVFPPYTKSLDAAMTLIPAQYRLGTLIEFDGEGRWAAKLFNRGKPGGLPAAGGSLAALALVVTCLRARAGDGV